MGAAILCETRDMKEGNPSPLPPLYAEWFDGLLGGPIPSETRATCNDCAMCDSSGVDTSRASFFDPQSKCCTYLPYLPNYLVGMILKDDDPAMARGRATVEQRLDAGLAVTPRGLEWPLKTRSQYTQVEPRAFGRAQSFRCPHYLNEQGGMCGIWKYRNSVCSTWFCKYVRGSVGRNFWEKTKQLLLSVEKELAGWCALELNLDESALWPLLKPILLPGQVAKLKLEDVEEKVDPKEQRKLWANWYGREREFYRGCADVMRGLSWADVLSICSPEVQVRARILRKAYDQLISEEIPKRLRTGSFAVTGVSAGFYDVYHPEIGLDRFQMSERVMRLLPYFDGRATNEIVDQIISRENLRFTPELIRRLLDFKILAGVEEDQTNGFDLKGEIQMSREDSDIDDEANEHDELQISDLETKEELTGGSVVIHKSTDVTLKRGVID